MNDLSLFFLRIKEFFPAEERVIRFFKIRFEDEKEIM